MKDEAVVVSTTKRYSGDNVETMPTEAEGEKIGQWYWVARSEREWNDEKGGYDYEIVDRLMCVVGIGSNYVQFESVDEENVRVHIDKFDTLCRLEPNADKIITGYVEEHRQNVAQLMGEIKQITSSLHVPVAGLLPEATEETQAVVLHGSNGANIDHYKTSLIKASKETLPDLFKEIEEENKMMASWMQAQLIPLQAQAELLKPVIKVIQQRIFNVELYAGLTEDVVQILDGKPADIATPITLLQRRHYMDEECLADYETGGMDYKKIEDFDRWLTKPNNLQRILPADRCIVAFQVRRKNKEREARTLRDFIQVMFDQQMDKLTFLYIRNGAQLFRLNTAIEFGEKLFPDMERIDVTNKLYAYMSGGSVAKLITEHEYEVMKDEEIRHEASMKGTDKYGDPKSCICKTEKGQTYCSRRHLSFERTYKNYVPYADESVYFDDIQAHVMEEMAKHNRLVLVLQGLLDRSPVLHPHPPWRLYAYEDFSRALELRYDFDRALTTGDKPDFEAYRAKLNASIKTGTVTVGQEDVWETREAERKNERSERERSYGQGYYEYTRYRPHGDPGPGTVARVVHFAKKAKQCTFKWTRQSHRGGRQPNGDWGYSQVPCSLSVPVDSLLNADAYKKGDYHIFFDDPRTRQDYLDWAPLLLEAEEYKSGNRDTQLSGEAYAVKKGVKCKPRLGTHYWTNRSEKGALCDCGRNKWESDL